MGENFGAAFGAAANILVVGAIIWGVLTRVTDRQLRMLLALAVPVAFNVAVLLLKDSLTTDQKVWGAVATVVVSAAWVSWFRRQSFKVT